jgi:hypothetical protein
LSGRNSSRRGARLGELESDHQKGRDYTQNYEYGDIATQTATNQIANVTL